MEVKDDRPAESLSFAATNLVKPGLSSKRQQSEPPLNRNVFPPTPPPESDRTSSAASSAAAGSAVAGVNRGASVRNGAKPLPAKLNLEKARPKERYEIRDEQISEEPRRLGTQRAASESRGPQRRKDLMQQTRRRTSDLVEEDEYPSELYDMYRNSRNARNNGGKPKNQPRYIVEEAQPEEEDASEYDDGSFDENEFEMVSSRPVASRARTSSQSRTSSRRPDIRKVRVKVHAADDTRYIMVGMAVEFDDLVDRVRGKFAIRNRFKIKIRDDDMPDGDMTTMGDQDDLEMTMMTVKANAKKERLDMGKMEVRSDDNFVSDSFILTRLLDLGSGSIR
jgi:hypothetical protein